jgi:acyl-ACP thioesterase
MEAVPVYQKKYHIETNDVDFTRKLKLSSLFGYFQEIACIHADNLGVGVEKIEQKGVAWALIRIKVDLVRYPVWNEAILIETWYPEPKKFEFERDFSVTDMNGNIIIKAISSWIIFDIETRELRKRDLIINGFPPSVKERAFDCKLGKLKASGQMEIAYKKVVGYSDIDFNGHLNNSKYIDFIMDCFTMEDHKKYRVKTIEINYINEALSENTIVIFKDLSAVSSGLIYFEGINEKDNKAIFKAQIEIEAC